MPKLEEAKRLHKEVLDAKEVLKTVYGELGQTMQGDGQMTQIASIFERIDRELNEISNLVAQIVGKEVMK